MIGDRYENEKIDLFSSPEAFEKTRKGLEESVGQLILLVKPEDDGGYRGGNRVEDYTAKGDSLGVLMGVPTMDNSSDSGSLRGIVLPVEKYIHGILGFSPSVEEGPMNFNCRYASGIGISDSDILKNRVNIYVGASVIERIMDGHIVEYFKGMNHLGLKVSDEFYSKHEEEIVSGRSAFLNDLRNDIIEGLHDPSSLGEEDWRELYGSALGWQVEKDDLELESMISLSIGKYLENKF